jgi:O-antigen/teichoic acid export membrane protein
MITTLRLKLIRIKTAYQNPAGLKGRFLRGVTWSLIGVSIVQALKLVTSVIVARILGDVGYGELGIINSTVVTFSIFAGLGLGITATKYVAELRNQDTLRAGQIIGFLLRLAFITGLTMTVTITLFAPALAEHILNAPDLVQGLRIGALLLLLNALNGVQLGALAGLESFQRIARINTLDGALFVLLASIGAWFFGLSGVVAAYAVVGFVIWGISQWALRISCKQYNIRISYRYNQADWRVLWVFALPTVIVALATQPFVWLSRIMLANQPNGYAEVGVFMAAFAWTNLLLFLPNQVSKPGMPILADLYGQGQIARVEELFRNVFFLGIGTAAVLAIAIGFASPLIMKSYGDAFASSWPTLVILLMAYVLSAGTIVLRDVLAAFGVMWWQSLFSAVWGLFLIGSLSILLKYGSTGLALSYLIAFLTQFTLQFFFVRRMITTKRKTAALG